MRTFFKRFLSNFVVTALLMLLALAGAALAQTSPSPLPSGLPALDAAHGALMGLSAAMIGLIATALEFIFRLFKTPRPLSIAWMVVGFLRMGIVILKQVEQLAADIAGLLDKVLPQNAAAPATQLEVKKVEG